MSHTNRDNRIEHAIDRVLAGETEAFMEVVEAYQARLFAYFGSQIRSSHDVEGLVQETFLSAFQNLHQFRKGTNLIQWVLSIARHKLMSHLRGVYRARSLSDSLRAKVLMEISKDVHESAISEPSELLVQLHDCLGRLTGKARDLVQARYFEHVSVTDLASRMGTSVNAISSSLSRARSKLEVCIKESGET